MAPMGGPSRALAAVSLTRSSSINLSIVLSVCVRVSVSLCLCLCVCVRVRYRSHWLHIVRILPEAAITRLRPLRGRPRRRLMLIGWFGVGSSANQRRDIS